MVNDSDKPLLEKYDLQIDQLDYNFIRECKNVKTLERILIVLRSGEEGIFPDLIKFCENRLKELSPNSRLLHPVKRILRYSDLPENERNEIGDDIQKWSEELKSIELTTDVTEEVSIDMPPVRGQSLKIDSSKKEKAPLDERLKTKRCAQRSYSEWNKFDVDGELKKLDGREHQKISRKDKKKAETHSGLSKSVSVSGLSGKEREYVANLEKNKGNEAFKAGDYEEAIIYYTRSLSVLRSTVTLNNRAQAHLKLKNYLAAVQDCNEVISQEPNNIKALYRRGLAYKEEGICDLAKLDFKVVLELDPENKLAKEQLTKIKQLKMPKTANKKVFIEEVKDDSQNLENEARDNTATEKCTRLTIQEINSDDTMTKLTNLNYSSDEEDCNLQLPPKVKKMLKIKSHQNQQKRIPSNVCGNEIDKKPVIENKKIDVPKAKIVDMDSGIQSNSNKKLKSNCRQHDNEFVNIKIEDSVSNKDANCIKPVMCITENQDIKITDSENKRGKGIRIDKNKDTENKVDETKLKDSCTNPNTEEVQTSRKTVVHSNKVDETKIKDSCTNPNTMEAQTSRNTVGSCNKADETKIKDPYKNPNKEEVKTSRNSAVPNNKVDETKIKDPCTNLNKEEVKTSRNTVGSHNTADETKIKDPCTNANKEEVKTSRNSAVPNNKVNETKIKDPCTNLNKEEVKTSRNFVGSHNTADETKIKDPCTNANKEEVKTSRNSAVPNNKVDETKINDPCMNPNMVEVQTSRNAVVPNNEVDDIKIKDSCMSPNTKEVQISRNTVGPYNLNANLLNDICYEKCTLLNEADANEAKTLEKSTVLNHEQNGESRTENMAKLLSQISDGNNATFVEQKSYEKITPYEFLCTWWSNNAADDVKVGAEYLLKIQPQELPTIISNKLDTSMLCGLLKAIAGICKMGKLIEGEKYLYYLLRVPRIEVISMLLSDSEVQSIQHSFSTLEKRIRTMYVNKILQH